MQEIDKYIDLASQTLSSDKICKSNDIRYDFVHSVSLLLQDGSFFEFIHRSFQEYFFAKFIVNDRKLELENKLDNIDGLFSFAKLNFIAMIEDMNHDYFETEYVLKKLKALNEYFESIDAEKEPEKIFNKFTTTIRMTHSQKKDKFYLMIFNPYNQFKNKEMLINSFIFLKCKNFMNYGKKLYIDLSCNKVLKIHNEYNNFNIKLNMDKDKTIVNVIFDSNRELLIEFNCTEYAQYIKKSLNDYYHDILSRTKKQYSIIDEIIFKNKRLKNIIPG